MGRYYVIAKVSEELMKKMQENPTADRLASTKKACEAAGLKMISYEWVRGRFDIIGCMEGDFESVLGMKVAFINSGLITDMMIHEVFDYNKAFGKAADTATGVTKPGQ
jgi:uncharacterized protein with GYD domain|tara:strand:- start:980 stop:1303 length:324 start_codon:yes stop_codon:yes gene_type:complete